jgi:hypothetical protein
MPKPIYLDELMDRAKKETGNDSKLAEYCVTHAGYIFKRYVNDLRLTMGGRGRPPIPPSNPG